MNAKREHLRARIGVVLGFQARLGGLCDTFGGITQSLLRNQKFMKIWEKLKLTPVKYDLRKLEICEKDVYIPQNIHPTIFSPLIPRIRRDGVLFDQSIPSASTGNTGLFEKVVTETGYFHHHDTARDDTLFNEEEHKRLLKKTDEIRDTIEESGIRTNHELRKVALSLQNELEDIKRRLIQTKIN